LREKCPCLFLALLISWDMDIWFDIFAIVVFVLASGFFAAAEIAVVSVRRSRIQELIEQNHKQAKAVKQLLDDPDKFFAIVQIGMTVFPTMASALGGALAVVQLNPCLKVFLSHGFNIQVKPSLSQLLLCSFPILRLLSVNSRRNPWDLLTLNNLHSSQQDFFCGSCGFPLSSFVS